MAGFASLFGVAGARGGEKDGNFIESILKKAREGGYSPLDLFDGFTRLSCLRASAMAHKNEITKPISPK